MLRRLKKSMPRDSRDPLATGQAGARGKEEPWLEFSTQSPLN